MRVRIPFNIFKITIMQMASQMSSRYNPNEGEKPKEIMLEPKITNKVMMKIHLYKCLYIYSVFSYFF